MREDRKTWARWLGLALLLGGVFLALARCEDEVRSVQQEPLSAQDIFKQCADAVVLIRADCSAGNSVGTGFFINNEGWIVTNKHVVSPPENLGSLKQLTVRLLNKQTYAAQIMETHERYDLALIKIDLSRNPCLYFANALPEVGEELYIIGHPIRFEWSLSEGKVSQIRNDVGGDPSAWIQTFAAINPGNSGGPLLNKYGYVVGVVTQKFQGEGVEGMGFGIAAPVARRFIWKGRY